MLWYNFNHGSFSAFRAFEPLTRKHVVSLLDPFNDIKMKLKVTECKRAHLAMFRHLQQAR